MKRHVILGLAILLSTVPGMPLPWLHIHSLLDYNTITNGTRCKLFLQTHDEDNLSTMINEVHTLTLALARVGFQRSASLKIDWTRLTSQLGLKGTTATSLAAFKKRNDDARRKVALLSEQPQSVEFEHYRSILNNKAVVDEIERQVKPYKPATYDVGRQIKAIEAFEATAVKSAEETKAVVDQELSDLNRTLKNIEEARPIDQLTVVCVLFRSDIFSIFN